MRPVETREEAVHRLRSGCEQCISCLKDLLSVHFDMDAADRVICPDDEAIVYRLRKVLLHVKAITGWELDPEVMHVPGTGASHCRPADRLSMEETPQGGIVGLSGGWWKECYRSA